jgi:hypothetical protein
VRVITEMEGGGDNNNNNNNNNNGNYYNQDSSSSSSSVDMYRSYWMGPSCSAQDGKSINLAVFLDAGCYTKAKTGVYEAFNYGASLPYENEPLVDWTECISCVQADDDEDGDDNNNNNNNNNNNSKCTKRSKFRLFDSRSHEFSTVLLQTTITTTR